MRKLKYPMTEEELNELLKPPDDTETIWPLVCACILWLAQSVREWADAMEILNKPVMTVKRVPGLSIDED